MVKSFLSQFKYGHKGFTLVELLITAAVLGLSAAIALRL